MAKPDAEALIRKLLEDFDWDDWNARIKVFFMTEYRFVVNSRGKAAVAQVNRLRRKKADAAWRFDDPAVQRHMTTYVGERIVDLDATTKAEVTDVIRTTLDRADGNATTADFGTLVGDTVRDKFDGYAQYRADRIARTETAIAYNHGTILGYGQAGVTRVDVLDGEEDPECAAANGSVWTLAEALEKPVEHPNCERDFSPIIDEVIE